MKKSIYELAEEVVTRSDFELFLKELLLISAIQNQIGIMILWNLF